MSFIKKNRKFNDYSKELDYLKKSVIRIPGVLRLTI